MSTPVAIYEFVHLFILFPLHL